HGAALELRREERNEHAARERHQEDPRRGHDSGGSHARHDGGLTADVAMTQPTELKFNLHQLLRTMVEKGASDLHITTNTPPLLRIDGEMVPLKVPPM